MDELQLLEFIKQNGLAGIMFGGVYAIAKFSIHQWQKSQGTSYSDIKMKISALEDSFKVHLEKEAIEDVKFGVFESTQKALKEKFETENNHIFSQLRDIHTKLDSVMKILIERK